MRSRNKQIYRFGESSTEIMGDPRAFQRPRPTRERDKQITLDILTGLSASEAGREFNLTHQAAGRIVVQVVKEAGRATEYAIPGIVNSVTSAKATSKRLIPIVHNHYKV